MANKSTMTSCLALPVYYYTLKAQQCLYVYIDFYYTSAICSCVCFAYWLEILFSFFDFAFDACDASNAIFALSSQNDDNARI